MDPEQNQWINDHNCRRGATTSAAETVDGISKKVFGKRSFGGKECFPLFHSVNFQLFYHKIPKWPWPPVYKGYSNIYIHCRLRRLFWWPQLVSAQWQQQLEIKSGCGKWLYLGPPWYIMWGVDDKGGILFCSWFETLIKKIPLSSTFLWLST